ncbi:MAG: exosortase, partial [Planctomycetaceae bacterium]
MAISAGSRRAKEGSNSAELARSSGGSSLQGAPADLKLVKLLGAAFLLLFVWAYWSTLVDIVDHWNSNPDYSHGFIVVPLALYLLWSRKESCPLQSIEPSWWGLSLIAAAGLARIASARLYLPEVDGWSIPIWVAGSIWICAGWKVLRWAAAPVAFLWFMVPLPATIETLLSRPLQLTATRMSTWVLECLGQPALAEGTTILLNEHNLEVERACSGLRMFWGILALSIAYVMLTRASWRRIGILILSVLPIALIVNSARIVITGLLFQWTTGAAAEKFSHDFAGYVMILMATALFMALSSLITRFERRLEKARSGMMLAVASYLLIFVIVIPALYLWHAYQQNRNVQAFLTRATALEEENEWSKAADYLDRYLRIRPDDTEIRVRLAETFDKGALSINRKSRALDLYLEAWNADPTNRSLGKRHAELALELGRPELTIESAEKLLAGTANDSSAEAAADHAFAARYKALAMILQMASDEYRGDQDRWKGVVKALEEALTFNPADIELAVRLAEIYRRRLQEPEEKERIRTADGIIDKLVEKNADEPVAYLARYDYRTRYRPQNATPEIDAQIDADLDRALELGKQKPERESLEVALSAGARAFRKNDHPTAIAHYRRATELQPRDYRGWMRLGEVEFEGGTKEAREKAVITWKQGVTSVGRQEIQLVIPIIGALIDLGRIPEAEEQLRPLEQIIAALTEPAKSSMQVGVTMLQARVKASLNQHGDAAAILKKFLAQEVSYDVAQRLRPQFARVWKTLGDYYTTLQSPDQAAYAYEQAGRLDSTTEEWHWKAARACETAGRFADAVQLLETASRKTPTNNAVWVALARVSLIQQIELSAEERDWQLFERAVNKAREAGANPSYLAILLSDRYMADEKPKEAVDVLEKAVASQPDSSELWRSITIIRNRLKQEKEFAQAMAEYKRTTKDPAASVLLEVGLLAGEGKLEDAATTLETAIQSAPAEKQFELRLEKAQLQLQSGKRDEARDLLQQLSKERPGDVELHEMRARLALEYRDWTALEAIEKELKHVEGEQGAVWRDFRARRLLALATDVEDEQFREAVRVVNELDRVRPAWHRTASLRGQIARREGRPAEAITAFENSIRLGNKGIVVAEELIDLLTEQRRFTEADRQLNRVRDAVNRSSRLSSVAIPIYVRRGESNEAMRLAEDWVAREPNDPSS